MRQTPTLEEDMLWQKLRNRGLLGYKFRCQHAIDRFIVDFYCAEARLFAEVDGPVHQYTHEEDAIPDVLDRIAHAISSPVTK